MLILIILFVVAVGGFILSIKSYDWDAIGFAVGGISTILLAVALLMLPISRNEYWRSVAKYEAFKKTIEHSRNKNISDIERVAILNEIAKWNQRIAERRYDNGTIFDIWVPDHIETLQPFE